MNNFIFEETIFSTDSLILISNGDSTTATYEKTSEIISFGNDNLVCSNIDDYPIGVAASVGVNLRSIPVVCGGYGYDDEKARYKFLRCFKSS